jgi:hypothetical protein
LAYDDVGGFQAAVADPAPVRLEITLGAIS